MGAFKYILKNERSVYKNPDRKKELLREITESPAITRVPRPTRLARAKSLGYSSKKGVIVVRVRVSKGSFRRARPVHARRPSKTGLYFNYRASKLEIAKHRAENKYKNMKAIGGYFLIDNGKYKWYEVIMSIDSA